MRDSEKNVGRADHNLEGARSVSNESLIDKATGDSDSGPTGDNPDRRAHGTHGRGRDQEKVQEDVPSDPDGARGSDRGGSASWGSEGSGGSVKDKRSPDR